MSDEIELSVQGEVAFVRLKRPGHGNALRGTMFDELRRIGLRLTDVPPRFVVLCGEGDDFCAGLDPDPSDGMYRVLEPLVRNRDAHRSQEVVKQIRHSVDLLGRLPCPVVAAIEGRCHGAGLELALVADLRVAGESATFRLGENRFGIVSGLGGLVRLTVLAGPATAQDALLTGRTFAAHEAVTRGIVHRAVPAGSAVTAALDLVHEIRRAAPVARLQGLLAMRAIHHRIAQDLYEHEGQAAARTWIAGEWALGLAAAQEGREPSW